MRRARFFMAVLAVIGCVSAARAARLEGSVFLFPIESEFKSDGTARYLNDLNSIDTTAVLSGEHSVNKVSPSVVDVYAVYAEYGSYSHQLTGTAQPGACYGTTLHIIGDPPGLFNTREQTWTGDTRCAPEGGTGCTSDCSFENDGPGANCPLILDLNGDGIQTTDASRPVYFDLDADGYAEHITWTNPRTREAFLWIDLITNHRVDDGSELFGIGTLLPSGERAPDGFAALAAYDDLGMGGDGDGKITVNDQVWGRLRLWVDANHDGVSQATEVASIHRHGVVEIPLQYVVDRLPDPSGNYHFFRGTYLQRVPSGHPETHALDDVFFRYVP